MAAKKVTIMVGFIPIRTKIEVAVDDEGSDLHTVCTGIGDDKHEPSRVRGSMECRACGRTEPSVWQYKERGYEDGDKVIVVDTEALAAAQGAPRTGRVEPVETTFCPREKVYAATVAGGSVQNIYPDKGGEKAYELLRDTLRENPDIVAVMIWAPTSRNSLWTLEVVEERIVATKRAWPEYVRPALNLAPAEGITDAERAMFADYVTGSVEDFDIGRYVDESKLGREELISSLRDGAVTISNAVAAQQSSPADLIAGLQASLVAWGLKPSAPAKKAAATKKAPAKKVAAKRAPAKKKVAAKKAPAKRAAKKTTSPKGVAA
jgi:DNA end-binding protein Ku